MKTYRILAAAATAALMLTACDRYLDVMPDNRAEVDSPDKVTKLLVAAYPMHCANVMEEMASDNATDNGSNYTVEDKVHEEAYLWEPTYNDDDEGAKGIWDSFYGAIANANLALQAIEDMGDPSDLSGAKAEALLCRAFSHFRLASLFCLAYDPATASKTLGLPYSSAPETEVNPQYERGNLEDFYAKINEDIENALPYVDDNIYTVPKYHFNKKAAYAFAARFNLYYGNMEKVIEYANEVLGSNPVNVLRDWKSFASLPSNWSVRCDEYVNAGVTANLLMTVSYSSWGYWGGPYSLGLRYGNAREIFMNEGPRAAGLWGSYSYLYMARAAWGMDQKLVLPKIAGYFQYTDKVQGIGYRMNVNVQFTTDETLLCRAEAYARLGRYDEAVADINTWLLTNTTNGKQVKLADIVSFYNKVKYMPEDHISKASDRTVKKHLHPVGFTIEGEEGDEMESLLQCILHIRRVVTVHEGLRWGDIKRYGIIVIHPRESKEDDVLGVDDLRRAFQLPADVIDAGLQANPR